MGPIWPKNVVFVFPQFLAFFPTPFSLRLHISMQVAPLGNASEGGRKKQYTARRLIQVDSISKE